MAQGNPYITYGSNAPITLQGDYDYLLNKKYGSGSQYYYNYGDGGALDDYWSDDKIWEHHDFKGEGTQRTGGWTLEDITGQQSYSYQGLGDPVSDALRRVFNTSLYDMDEIEENIIDQMATRDYLVQGAAGINEGYGNRGARIHDFGIDWGDLSGLNLVNIFDPESIAEALSLMEGLTGSQAIKSGEVQALTPEMFEKTESEYYEPVVTSKREELIDSIAKRASTTGTGGFAGSGTRASEMTALDRLYRGGHEDILADIMKMKAQSSQDIMDIIYGWAELGPPASVGS